MDESARIRWAISKQNLMDQIASLGFPADLGEAVAQNLGSPKAMDRMTSYLKNVRPTKAELVVDEMLAICSEIEAWRERKASQEANAHYNEMRYFGWAEEDT